MNKPSWFESHAPTLFKVWQHWKRIAAKIAEFQGRLLLSIIYMLIVGPIALLMRLIGQDPLAIRLKNSSYWVHRPAPKSVSESMHQQF